MIYRVVIKIGYCEAFFDFSDALEASTFATVSLEHMSDSEDQNRLPELIMRVIRKDDVEDDA